MFELLETHSRFLAMARASVVRRELEQELPLAAWDAQPIPIPLSDL
jgi:hypothetical protein